MEPNDELIEFCKELFEDVNAEFLTNENGATPEQVFTEHALQLLEENGYTENYHVCFDEKPGKKGTDHKVNAYSLYENYETLDLFITIYDHIPEPRSILKAECEKALNRLTRFFRNTVSKGYVNEIEESSEIFDLANTLYNIPDVKEYLTRVNLFILTSGTVRSELEPDTSIAGIQIYNHVVDIEYLYKVSEKKGTPIKINFAEMGYKIPCISVETSHGEYQTYLTVIPGQALAEIYEKYGPRLLEQNVRTFLQFTGKINKGIRKTIIDEPHMFLAFNNGIAATADEIEIEASTECGKIMVHTTNFQIVNGGQTTASIFHTWKKNKVDISEVNVPVKLTIIANKEKVAETVSRIAEFANTQNKVSTSDLSSNREGFILLEKISRACWTPPQSGSMQQTRWFFERSRGQFRNERNRNGYTLPKKKAFDIQNPRSQLIAKEQIAKYINSFQVVSKGNKIVIGPHFVVRGNQKNYVQFLTYNFINNPDQAYFEDVVAKAIFFKTAEKVYGVKPNSIGDLRYVTVPYSISWLSYQLNNSIDFYKIWKSQRIPKQLEANLRDLMIAVEEQIKCKAPGALYGEYAKKEDCWNNLKSDLLTVDIGPFKKLLVNKNSNESSRPVIDIEKTHTQQYLKEIIDMGADNWKNIYLWCKVTDSIPLFYKDIARTIGKKVRDNITFSNKEIVAGYQLLNLLAEKRGTLETICTTTANFKTSV